MKPTRALENRLTTKIKSLEALNNAMKQHLELRNMNINSGTASLIGQFGGGPQSAMNSFNNLAYFNIYQPITINWTLLSFMYKTHGILQTAIDMPVMDALRGGIDIVSSEIDQDDVKELEDVMERNEDLKRIGESHIWTRLYGGGALVVNSDGQPTSPLKLKQGCKLEFYPASRWELQSTNRETDTFEFYGIKVDSSRVITQVGKAAPYLVKFVLQGWGMSEMERMIEDFNLYLRTKDVVYELLKEAKVDIYKFEGYTNSLATSAGLQLTQTRLTQINQIKSYLNALLMDKNDDYEQKQITFAGLAEVQKQNMIYIASALRMPLTKIFGLSASGFNSGEDDMENYNALVETEPRTQMRPVIRKVIEYRMIQLWGKTFDFDFNYMPLRVLDDVQQETVNTSKYNRYLSIYEKGGMDPQEFFGLCHKEGLIPIETSAAKGTDPFEQPQIEHQEEKEQDQMALKAGPPGEGNKDK